MANTYSAFQKKEDVSKLETPWGDYEITGVTRGKLKQVDALQKEIAAAQPDSGDVDLERVIDLTMKVFSFGLVNGEECASRVKEAWESDEITLDQLNGAVGFIVDELGGAAEKKD